MTQRKVTSVTLILLLVCATCIAPALASQHRETTVVDGVHLVTFDDSPTILNSKYYYMEQNMDFIVDGTQNYWVRIGNVKAKELSSNELARLVCTYGLYIGAFGGGIFVGAVTSGAEMASFGTATPIVVPIIGLASGFVVGIAGFANDLCPKVAKWAL